MTTVHATTATQKTVDGPSGKVSVYDGPSPPPGKRVFKLANFINRPTLYIIWITEGKGSSMLQTSLTGPQDYRGKRIFKVANSINRSMLYKDYRGKRIFKVACFIKWPLSCVL